MLIQNDVVPLYKQVKELIRNSILNDELKLGEKLLSEAELIEKYNVSRITIRNAISELVEEGYLIKKQGKGTFVVKLKFQRKIVHPLVLNFSAACEANGLKASGKVLKKEILDPGPEDKQSLKLDDFDKLIYIQRIRYADDIPLMIENNYFSYKNYNFLLTENLNTSLFELLRKKYGINPSYSAETSIEIIRASDKKAKLLEVSNGEPLFYMRGVTYDDKDCPVHLSKHYIIGERYKFVI